MILDVCCGGKMFYFDKLDERVTFMDIRNFETVLCDGRKFEVKPDLIGNFTNIPFEDNTFQGVIFDPPHLKGESNGYQKIKYGHLNDDWPEVIANGFKECFRVLKPSGFLIFKWNETDIKVKNILALTEHKPILGHISGKRSNTHWILFIKEGNNG